MTECTKGQLLGSSIFHSSWNSFVADCWEERAWKNLLIPNQGASPPSPPPSPPPSQGPLTSISVMSGSSGAQGGVGEAGGTGSASRPLSSVIESVPEESVGSMVARLSRDTLVQAEDRLRFRHQCIGSWDIRGSTLGRSTSGEGQGEPQALQPRHLF